jgi:hypothetical protein
MLLAHGPLSMAQFKEITGWPAQQATNTIKALLTSGTVEPIKTMGLQSGINLYALASASTASGSRNGTQKKQSGSTNVAGGICHG